MSPTINNAAAPKLQRRKEVGIRIAFGDDRSDILGLIIGETCRLAILGSVLGCAAAFIAGCLATHTVYLSPSLVSSVSQENLSPAVFLFGSLLLFAVAICASYARALSDIVSEHMSLQIRVMTATDWPDVRAI